MSFTIWLVEIEAHLFFRDHTCKFWVASWYIFVLSQIILGMSGSTQRTSQTWWILTTLSCYSKTLAGNISPLTVALHRLTQPCRSIPEPFTCDISQWNCQKVDQKSWLINLKVNYWLKTLCERLSRRRSRPQAFSNIAGDLGYFIRSWFPFRQKLKTPLFMYVCLSLYFVNEHLAFHSL